jgi:O-antigen ligase
MKYNKLKELISGGQLTFFISLTVVIILPLYIHYLPPFMILWVILWLGENKFMIKKSMYTENKAATLFLLFIVFYCWQISGLFLADSFGSGIERIYKRLSFLLFPMVLFYPGERILKNINLIIRLFAIFAFIYLIYCLGNALHNSIVIKDGTWIFNPHPVEYNYENFFYSSRLSDPVHPTYFSMYIVLSILISLEAIFHDSSNLLKRGIWLTFILVFLIALYLLSSRAGMLAAIIVIPLYFIYRLSGKYSGWIILVPVVLMVFIFLKIAWTNDKLYYNVDGITKSQPNEIFKKDVRYNIWKSAFGVIKQNPVLGVGTGDASWELKEEFKRRGYNEGYYDDLNSHNQFIEVLLENGLIGLILFLGIIGYMFYISISDRNLLFGLYILMMIVFFFFETVLNRLAGIAFFPLFSFLLFHVKYSRKV